MKTKFTILLIILTNLCFGQDDFKEFKADKYSVSYPATWRLDSSGTMNTKFILFSELKEKDTFNENINMVIQDLTGQGFTMESYVKLSENQIKNMIFDGKILENVYDTVNEHHTLIWSGNVTGEVLKFKQYYFLKNELLYLLTLTTRPDTYEEYILIGEKILDSFKLK